MSGTFLRCVVLLIALWPVLGLGQEPVFEDTMAERTRACSHCHGKQGRAGPDGYYPRLAGKPAAYLYNQLLNFREGRRHYSLMSGPLEPLTDAYLMEMAQYFAGLNLPYPQPMPVAATTPAQLARGKSLVMQGDPQKKIPACISCHGDRLTGALPHVPGLLGLPRDYLNAQLGGWQTGQRRAHGPDCMATIATQLDRADVSAISHWLAAQTVPADSRPQAQGPMNQVTGQANSLGCGSAPAPARSRAAASSRPAPSDQSARGAYLARIGNCQGCHTVTGGANYAGGRGIETPFGTVYTSNLTADRDSGIGAWSSEDFWQAMHEGRSKDQRLLYPAFPYPSFTLLSRTDSDALFAFLKTVPAVKQTNQSHALRWPYRTQTALAVWRALYFKPGGGARKSSPVSVASRGADLVNGLGHCGTCHTPRNMLGASRSSLDLQGGMLPMQRWYAPSLLDPQEGGLGDWSLNEISLWLQTGVSARGVATGPMAQVVLQSTQYLSDDDRLAMATYLKSSQWASVAPAPQPRASGATLDRPLLGTRSNPPAGSERPLGADVYEARCKLCHGEQAQGVPDAYPALAGNRTVTMPNASNLIQTILWGGYTPATAQNPRPFGMPPFVLNLSDREIAALSTYLRSSWGNRSAPVTELEVSQAREKP
jgi:cytochrome c553